MTLDEVKKTVTNNPDLTPFEVYELWKSDKIVQKRMSKRDLEIATASKEVIGRFNKFIRNIH